MAICEKKTKTVEETVQVVKTKTVDDGVMLHLTDAEAQTLSQLLTKTGGYDQVTGHRRRLGDILHSLQKCGFNVNFELPEIGIGWIYGTEGVRDASIKKVSDL